MEFLKVLVVDDEPGIRSGVTRILSKHIVSYPFMDEDCSFTCFEAGSGEEGIEMIEAEMPDILLLDNKLPGIKGMEVLEYVRQKNYNIMIAMITSYASLELAIKATNDGAYDFIPKPFTPQELKSSIDNITKQLFLRRISSKMKQEGKKIRYQFLSMLSHELKAPLTAVEGYLKIIKEKQAGNDIAAYEGMVDRALERIEGMRVLTMDLLDFTKIRLDNRTDKVKMVNLRDTAKMSISTVKPYAIQKNVSIKLESEGKIEFEADPCDMEIIFNNLLSNAVKYNHDNGTVTVSLIKTPEGIFIKVNDTGIGMAKDELAMLFKEFVRIKNDKTKNISGSGLGLSIVRKISDIYHGKISVTSVPDEGTTFTVFLPV